MKKLKAISDIIRSKGFHLITIREEFSPEDSIAIFKAIHNNVIAKFKSKQESPFITKLRDAVTLIK